jgi:hypothetical protein
MPSLVPGEPSSSQKSLAAEAAPHESDASLPAQHPLHPLSDSHRLHHLLRPSTARTASDYAELTRLSANYRAPDTCVEGSWEEEDTAELTALIAEYDSLRQESMNTINNRTQILLLEVAAIGALTIDNLPDKPVLVYTIFSGAIPLTCVFVFMVWLSEAIRSHRAGYFLAACTEAKINAKLGRLVISWEATLWTGKLPRDELFGPSMMALGVVGLLALAAPLFGLFLTRVDIGWTGRPLLQLWIPYVTLAAAGLYTLTKMKRLKNIPTLASPM